MKKRLTALLCACMLALLFAPAPRALMEDDVSAMYKKKDVTAEYDEAKAVSITLTQDTWSADSFAISQQDSTLTITAAGDYILSGTWDGQIAVECGKEDDVRLILKGVTVKSPIGPALYVKSADKVILTLAPETVNTFTDQASMIVDDNEISSCVYSKDDLSINGTGALEVNGAVGNGIVCKNDLIIADGVITVSAVNDAVRGKDSVLVLGGTLDLTAGGDGIASTAADDEKGNVTIAGGDFTVKTGSGAGEAASAQTGMMNRGNMWGGSATTTSADETSRKGIKAAAALRITGGTFTLDCEDDALHAKDVTVSGGEFSIKTGDDGAHADDTLAISGGTFLIAQSYEGLESANVLISGGMLSVTASDDGINAAGGNDGSSQKGWGAMDQFAAGDYQISISGGTLHVNAAGDGLDSNGSLNISGGETYISGPTDSANGAIDYAGTCAVTGGVFVAAGSSGMMQNVSSASGQAALLTYLTASADAGTAIVLKDESGNELLSYTPEKAYACVLISTPQMQPGKTYQLLCGNQTAFEAQLSQNVTTNGTGGGFGGFGGHGGKDGGFRPDTNSGATQKTPGTSPDGQTPPERPDGTTSATTDGKTQPDDEPDVSSGATKDD